MTTLDYTFDRQIMLEREDALREGREEGTRLLKEVFASLKAGVSEASLEEKGYSKQIIRIAKEMLE